MPTKRTYVDGYKTEPCYDLDHNPPTHIVYPPGTYEHVCPSCGKIIRFVVQNKTCLKV